MASNINEVILAEAMKSRGIWEWAGKDHNPKVVAMYADAGHPEVREDEVPWCAAFVGSVFSKVGLRNTGSLLAKSYLKWGKTVPSIDQAMPGDLIVLDRGTQPWQGHVTFLVNRIDKDTFRGLGGNQNNQVKISTFKVSDITKNGIRRAELPKASMKESTTAWASATGAATAVGTGATAVSQLDGTAQIVAVVGIIVIILAFAWIFRERLKKFAAGVR